MLSEYEDEAGAGEAAKCLVVDGSRAADRADIVMDIDIVSIRGCGTEKRKGGKGNCWSTPGSQMRGNKYWIFLSCPIGVTYGYILESQRITERRGKWSYSMRHNGDNR